MLVGHGSWGPSDGMVNIPLGSAITFLCGPGGFISGGVTKAVTDCIVNKSNLDGVLKNIIPIGVIPDFDDYTATYDVKKQVPAKASKYPRTVSSNKKNDQQRCVHDYTLGPDDGAAYLMTFIDGETKAKKEYTEAVKISKLFGDCKAENKLPAQFIWVACRDMTYSFNPKYSEISWITVDELETLTASENEL
jgi:hypothetical protein